MSWHWVPDREPDEQIQIDASPDEQLYRAQLLYQRSGAGQWGCGEHLFD